MRDLRRSKMRVTGQWSLSRSGKSGGISRAYHDRFPYLLITDRFFIVVYIVHNDIMVIGLP